MFDYQMQWMSTTQQIDHKQEAKTSSLVNWEQELKSEFHSLSSIDKLLMLNIGFIFDWLFLGRIIFNVQ